MFQSYLISIKSNNFKNQNLYSNYPCFLHSFFQYFIFIAFYQKYQFANDWKLKQTHKQVFHCQEFEEHYLKSSSALVQAPWPSAGSMSPRGGRGAAVPSLQGKVMAHRQRRSLLLTSLSEEGLSLDQQDRGRVPNVLA